MTPEEEKRAMDLLDSLLTDARIQGVNIAQERIQELERALVQVVRYLADLNGSEWILGDGPGEIDMRQRAKALQAMANNVLNTK